MSFKTTIADVGKELESTRSEIFDLHAQEQTLLAAPVTVKQAVTALTTWVDKTAAQFESQTPILARLYHGDTLLGTDLDPTQHGRDNLTTVLCYLCGDAIKQRMAEAITKQIGREGLTTEARETKLQEVRKKCHGLEIREEMLIRDVEAVGMKIDRRPDAAPAVVLGALTEE